MERVIIQGEPADSTLPTVGPWIITCSACGPLGMALSALSVDNALIAHGRVHSRTTEGAL